MTEQVEVKQEDREAAADFSHVRGLISRRDVAAIQAGEWDDWNVVQAFARHARATEARLASRPEQDVVEHVARAVCAQGGFDPDEVMANDGPRWRYYVPGVRAAIAAMPPSDQAWQPIENAPKDGTAIVAWCVHPYASSMFDPEEYVGPVVARWIDHNGGGWTWHGHLGNFTHWMPLPEAPAALTQERP